MLHPSGSFAQDRSYVVSDSINWQPVKNLFPGHSLLFFNGAVNHDSLGFLPVYTCNTPKDHTGKISSVNLVDAIYEQMETIDMSMFPDIDLVREQPVIIVSTSHNRKIPLQTVYLLPLRKTPGKEGIEKLVSFKIKICLEDDPVNAPAGNTIKRTYTENSVLSKGEWYRIAARETGIYKISSQDLESMGINPGQIDPRNIRIYGNGSGMLEEANSLPRKDDLMENAIFIEGESDGSFDPEDYILFYGESPVTITYNDFFEKYEHEVNFYTDQTCYFLNISDGPGKRVQPQSSVIEEPTYELNDFEEIAYYEKDSLNLIKSGKIWYGEVFNTQLEYFFDFNLKDLNLEEALYLKVNLAGRSTSNTTFNLMAEGSQLVELDCPSIVLGSSIYGRSVSSNYELFHAQDENIEVGISFDKIGSIDVGWLNYIELNYKRHLKFSGGQLSFRDMRPVGDSSIVRYHIQTSIPGLTIWEVSDPGSISVPMVSEESGGISIKMPAETLKEFIAFDGSQFFAPEFIEKVENQNLHNLQPVDLVIITYPLFLDQAHRLADYHRQWDAMNVHVVTPQQIYNEFSSGAQDVSAIRDFMKMLYDREEKGKELRYLLLFGDASFDYKNLTAEDNNMVPAYESRESLKSAASFVTDDFFGRPGT